MNSGKDKETLFRERLRAKAMNCRKEEEDAVDAKCVRYNAEKWAYVDALDIFNEIFGEGLE